VRGRRLPGWGARAQSARWGKSSAILRLLTASSRLALAGVLVLLGACEELGPEIDQYPIPANTLNGPLRIGARPADDDTAVAALVDTNTPLSVLDRSVEFPRRLRTDLDLLAACGGADPVSGCNPVSRARYTAAAMLEMHPCATGAGCRIGLEPLDGSDCGDTAGPETVGYGAIIGSDLLSQAALRVDLTDDASPSIRLFPDIAGDAASYCEVGVAVIPTPLAGAATIAIEGGEVSYIANRLPVNVCADFDVVDDDVQSGTDLLLLLSTGVGPTVISESAYTRYYQRTNQFCIDHPERCGADPDQLSVPPFYSELPAQCLHLPSGPTVARVASVRRVSLAGPGPDARSPCEERRAALLMNERGSCQSATPCPCPDQTTSCETDAAVDLEPPAGIPVAVLPDSHPLLQGLREELRPGQAEVDGLLGLDALRALRLDIDYPGSRLLVTCGEGDGSTPRPPCTAYTQVARPATGDAASRCPAR